MVEIKELLDLDKTIAKELFDGKTYPWEVLDGIKDFILKLGPTLDANGRVIKQLRRCGTEKQ